MTVAPKYVKLCNSSGCTPSVWISTFLPPMVLTIILFLSVLIVIPYA